MFGAMEVDLAVVSIASGQSFSLGENTRMAEQFAGFSREAMDFFKKLEKNNNREWFQANKDVYERTCREPMKALVDALAFQYGPSKISRINRDMRFARDRPYKTYIAAGVGGNYISLFKEGLYVGTGMYKPEPAVLARFRAAIADDTSGLALAKLVASLRRKGYKVDTHERLASAPKGYSPDHPRIDLLRMKDIHAGKLFPPAAWLATEKALDRITKVMEDIQPLREWLRRYVGTSQRQ
jgi:uncharacterized protein (TIGR02453 family)